MGTSRSFAELAGKLEKAANKLATDKTILEGAALQVKKAAQAELRAAAPRGVLKGAGKSGAKVGVSSKAVGKDSIIVRMTGPAHLIERDTAAHLIGAGRGRTVAGRKFKNDKQAARLGKAGSKLVFARGSYGHPAPGPVRHPGTKGKHPWEKSRQKSPEPIRKEFGSRVADLLGEVF